MKHAKITIIESQKTIYIGNRAVHLPPKQYLIAVTLINANGNIVSKKELLSMVWGTDVSELGIKSHTIAVQIHRLRKRFGKRIETKPTWGYRWVVGDE